MTKTYTLSIGALAALLYLSCIIGANWAVNRYGVVPIGFGLMAPAGVFFVGVAFTLRDVTQRLLGVKVTLGAVVLGASLSYFISPSLAVASGSAFLLSELADLSIYTPLVARGRSVEAVVLSNTAGAIIDSAVFLYLAFGSFAFIQGQVVGKMMMTLAALPLVWASRRWLAE